MAAMNFAFSLFMVLSTCFFLASRNVLATEATSETVTIIPRWKVGEKRHYDLLRIKAESRDGAIKRTRMRSKVEIEILEVTRDNTRLRWSTSESMIEGLPGVPNEREKKMLSLQTDISLLLDVSSEGAITTVVNWKEAYEKIEIGRKLMVDELKRAASEDGVNIDILDKTMPMFVNEKQMKAEFIGRIGLFFLVAGKTYSASEPLLVDAWLPIDDELIPAQSTFRLRSYDPLTSEAVIRYRQHADSEEFSHAVEKKTRAIVGELSQQPFDSALIQGLSMEVVADFTVETRSGWVNRMKHKIVTSLGAIRKGELLTMTRVEM